MPGPVGFAPVATAALVGAVRPDNSTCTVDENGILTISHTGTVTSIALTAPAILSVTGSPVTGSGTLALSLATQDTHLAWLGPLSGTPAAPTFRAIDYTDLPRFNGPGAPGIVPDSTGQEGSYLRADGSWAAPPGATSGTVTSVALSAPGILSVAGSPITTAGTLALTLHTQAAHAAWLGPLSGPDAAPTFRAVDSTDLPTFAGAAAPGIVPDSAGHSGAFLRADATWHVPPGTGGSLTEFSATFPGEFVVVVNNPTTTPHLVISKANEAANTVWAGPIGGSPGAPGFRGIVSEDLPIFGGPAAPGIVPDPVTEHSYFLRDDGTWASPGGTYSGTVTSVALAAPGMFSVSGSPVTTAGTLTLALTTQGPNVAFMGPLGGSPAAPGFRAIVSEDLPPFGGAAAPGIVPDPVTEHSYFLRDDGAWASPSAAVLDLHVTDGTTTVTNTAVVHFGAHFAVADGGSGVANVTSTNPGITVTDGTTSQSGVTSLTVGLATVLGSAPAVSISPSVFGGASLPGVVPDPITSTGNFLRDDGTWANISATPSYVLHVTQGATDVHPVGKITFSDDFTVTDATGGWAQVGWVNPGLRLVEGGFDESGVKKLTVVGASMSGSAPDVTLTVPSLTVGGDSGGFSDITELDFVAGADVTHPSAGVVHIALTSAGITVVDGADTQTNVHQLTFVGAALTGSSPDVTLTIDAATALTVSDGSSGIHPATTIAFTEGIEMTQPTPGTAAIAVRGIGMEVSDGTHDEAGVFSLLFPVTTVTFDSHTATVVPATFDGPGVPGMVPDPTSSTGRFLRDDATWQPITTGYPALSAFMVTLAAPFEYDLPTGGWQNVGTAGMGATLVAGTWFLLLSLQVEAPGRTAGDTLPSWNIRLWDDTNNAELASGSVALGVDTPFYATVTCMCMVPLTAAATIVAQMRVSATGESGSIRVASALGSVGASRLWGQRMS